MEDSDVLISQETATTAERRGPKFGARHVFAIMGFLGFVNVYAMRVNLSVAIVVMVNSTSDNNSSAYNNLTCPIPSEANSSHPDPDKEGPFDWDEQIQSQILGSFFYGYVVTQIPGGMFAERYGGKWIFGIGVLITSIFTLITPVAAKVSYFFLIAVRVIEGLGEGVTFPVMHAMLSQWAPPLERTQLVSFIYAGSQMGTVISLPISGILCDTLGWESVFYLFGALGILWFIFWAFLVFDNPVKHPWISEAERDYIEISLGKQNLLAASESEQVVPSQEVRQRAVPWSKILTSIAVWAIIVAHCCQNWGFYTLLTELPTYMSRILHYNIKTNAFLSALPYLLMWIMSVLGSLVADFLRSREILSTTAVRKIANSLAFYIPALSLVCMSFVGCQRDAVLALLCVTVGMNGLNYSGFNSNHIDIASNYAGTLMGITNTLANFMGFLAPMAVGAIIEDHNDLPHWQTVFFISASVYFVGNTFFLIFGTGKEQPWNHHDEPTSEADGPHVGPILRISNDDIGGVDVY